MFTDKLYTHKFDIDDIIKAMCGLEKSILNTQTGKITPCTNTTHNTPHIFILSPLPSSFVAELQTHPKQSQLQKEDRAQLNQWLNTASLVDLPTFFSQDFSGGWLRERVKDAALEWLDREGLIPPSMRHVRDSGAFSSPIISKVTIT